VAAHPAQHRLHHGRPLAGAGAREGLAERRRHGVGVVAVHRHRGDTVAGAAVGELAAGVLLAVGVEKA
jgi:hypothetical protein